MIQRIEHVEQAPLTIITRGEYETDLKRGYCIVEYAPATDRVLIDRRNPGREIRQPVERVVTYRCMTCRFDCVSGSYSNDPLRPTTGIDIMNEHLNAGQHPWPYNPFENPYGNIADVVIEGITDYSLEGAK